MARYMLLCGDGSDYIDELLSLCDNDHPHVLCIGLTTMFFLSGCYVDSLTVDDMASPSLAQEKINRADVICLADINAAFLMRRLRRYGADALLVAAAEDKVLCGIGEGAACLCAYGQSCKDAISSARITGLGLVDIAFCPRVADEPQRTGWFKAIMKRTPRITGVTLDHAALVIDDDRFRVFSRPDFSRARKCYWMKGQYYTDNLKSSEWHPLSKLMQKG